MSAPDLFLYILAAIGAFMAGPFIVALAISLIVLCIGGLIIGVMLICEKMGWMK